ncbi:hypothetical protein C8R44DRAFT_312841 [Mycena epipterygia]|nr:hypothetical protein C8R44DRAFT_312841 [Mycena epipterygia]
MLICLDGHAGYILYTRLSRMIPTMPKPPNATCYSFDVIRGRLCESSGMTWSPFNPDYDPGPPPPPKPVPGPSLRTSTGAVALSLGNSGLKRPLARDSSSHTLVGNKAGGDHDDSNSTSTPTVKRPRRYRQRPRRPA